MVLALRGYGWRKGTLCVGRGAWPGSVTQTPIWQWWLPSHSCHPSELSLCLAFWLDPWAILLGIYWSLGSHASGFLGPRPVSEMFPPPLPVGSSSCIMQTFVSHSYSVSQSHADLPTFGCCWCADLSDKLVCRLDVICWDVQLVIMARREIWGDPSCCHASDVNPFILLYWIF